MSEQDLQQFEKRFKDLEARLDDQKAEINRLKSDLSTVRSELDRVHGRVEDVYKKNVTTCKSCQTEYDLFAHHYSIGLFDNIVFVKCPKCHTAMPVDPKEGVKRE